MIRRIMAWLSLLGFLLLLANLFWWHVAQELSLALYIIILVAALFGKGNRTESKDE